MENFALAWPNLLWQTEDYMKGLSFAVLKVTLGVTSLWSCLIPGLQGSRNREAFYGVERTCSLCLKSDYFTPITTKLIMQRITKQWANLKQDFLFLLGKALPVLSQRALEYSSLGTIADVTAARRGCAKQHFSARSIILFPGVLSLCFGKVC